MRRLLSAALWLSALLPAQAEVPSPGPDAVVALLSPEASLVTAGGPVAFRLRVDVTADSELDAAVLGGIHLTFRVGDQEPVVVGEAAGTVVRVAAGTVIERRVEFALPAIPAEGMPLVAVAWPGLPGARASLEVAPDHESIDVDALDLARSRVVLVTNLGRMTLAFAPDLAPNHVRNFLELSRSGFYDGTRFHRVVRDKIVQGGCPNTKAGATGKPGFGSPGHTVDAEFSDARHVRGVVSMARGRDENSAGSQFFLCHGEVPSLDGRYTVFGRVDSGLDTLDKIAEQPVRDVDGIPTPIEPVHLYRAVVLPVLADSEGKK